MKPKIALLISGRATCWEYCLRNVLINSQDDYDIDLFMSINEKNKDCEYFKIMKRELFPYLKDIYIDEYKIPNDFVNTCTEVCTPKQLINSKYVPSNVLSMFFNYKNAYNMALKYEKNNNLNYDFFMIFRSDIIIDKIPVFKNIKEDVLYSINQPCQFFSFGIYKICYLVSPEWVYAKKNIFGKYMMVYDFILEQCKIDNNYVCHYESNSTDHCIEQKINVERIDGIIYNVDSDRRIFDNWDKVKDTRIHNIHSRTLDYIDITSIDQEYIDKSKNKKPNPN